MDVKDIIIVGGVLLGASYVMGKKIEDFLGFGDETDKATDAAAGFWDRLTGGGDTSMPDTTRTQITHILENWKTDYAKAEDIFKAGIPAPIIVTDFDFMDTNQISEYERLKGLFEETGELPFELQEITVTPPAYDTSSWEMVPTYFTSLGVPIIRPPGAGGQEFMLTRFLSGGYEDIYGISPTEEQYLEWYG